MSNDEHPLERRANLLASKIKERSDFLAEMLAPKGKRRPFTEQLSQPAAMAFWRRNRYTDLGQQILQNMSMEDILELDKALATDNEMDGMGGGGLNAQQY